jgi:NAD(P)-dependent dehydrogenase (short-subunit alcohol dehydrogenase family)
LLTSEVWPLLEKAAKERGEARIVNHSSGARRMGNKKMDARYLGKNGGNLGGDEPTSWIAPFSGGRWVRYQQTKLANVVFTYALHDKLAKANIQTSIKSLVAHPGLSATNLQVTTAADGGSA